MDAYTGEIRMFAGNFAPQNWALCDGSLLPIANYDVLYSLIGTTYGGDGQQTFALPDLRGRIPVHRDTAGAFPLGQSGGVETVTLVPNQLPVHQHPVIGSLEAGSQSSPSGGIWASSALNQYVQATPDAVMDAGVIAPAAGANQPHANVAPFLCLQFIICLNGVYPNF